MSSSLKTNIRERIFSIKDELTFNEVALTIFQFQALNNPIYNRYLSLLNIDIKAIEHYSKIPFLPIEFFKNNIVLTSEQQVELPSLVFKSSGTTGENTSSHYVLDPEIYLESCIKSFNLFYGAIENWNILALLPSYIERENSSLIYMVNQLMQISNKSANQFYLYNHDALYSKILELEKKKEPSILIGVSYALLDFAEKYQPQLNYTIVMETGGMKGKREEITKQAMHDILKKSFQTPTIHAEYGMTELLSQAYSSGNGLYKCPPWMKIICKELNDPFQETKNNQTGRINIIDLANIYSCSFIETADMGKVSDNDTFEIIGRIENALMRGCNLLIQ